MANRHWTLDHEIDEYLEKMRPPPKEIMDKLVREREPIEQAAPRPGDPAPDFTAERVSAAGARTGEMVRLTSLSGKPVALLFGNYTCPVYRGQIARFNKIYAELRDYFQFLNIYTREAHPADGWRLEINDRQGFEYDQPTTADQRANIIKACHERNKIEIPLALDNMDDEIERLYSGVPERLYIIDGRGTVTYRSDRGPFDMASVDSWHAALQEYAGDNFG